MERYETVVEDDILFLDLGADRFEVGDIDEIVGLVGGETYEVEYDGDHSQVVEWLDLDEDHTLEIDVRETITDMDFPESFVRKLAERDGETDSGHDARAAYFAEMMATIWESKGNLEDELGEKENPFY